ncbi:hypothetical protein M9Y10_043687 [Tritrichomonas musculus]|uniref:Alpha-actinin n=1 Tax=Tritrichomonas musculus TaxID=1915356 RepID=A0ABR2K0F9_9EUKA
MTILNKAWEETQIKVFSRWCAKYLMERNIPFESLRTEFENGVKLINLLEIIGKEQIAGGRWHKQPKNRYQQLENVNMALDYVQKEKKVKLIGIHADDIVDKNLKLTLGLIWSCINKFQIEDISVEEQTARNALLQWCKKNTQGYQGVNITNFTTSWNTGLAFCALINKFRPDVLDYDSLDKGNSLENCQKAFDACKKLGLYVYLDPEDVADVTPDEKSVVTQVSEFFHFFAGESKTEAMADKLRRTIEIQRELDQLKSNYAEQAQATMDAMNQSNQDITSEDYQRDVNGIKAKLIDVIGYTRVARPNIAELRGTALKTWGQLVARCKATNRPNPVPPQGLEPEVLTQTLDQLDNTATEYRKSLSSELEAAENQLIFDFDNNCNNVGLHCENVKNECLNLQGPLDQQKQKLAELSDQLNNTIRGFVTQLQPVYDQLVDLKLNYKAKNSITSISSQVDQADALIKHLSANLEALIEEEALMAKVNTYNQLCDAKVQESKQLDAQVENVNGDNEAKRKQLIQIDSQVSEKEQSCQELDAPYEELERDQLQLHANYTPDSVKNFFTVLHSHIQGVVSGIDAAIAASKGFEISEEQLAEFRETFRMFDANHNNSLEAFELNACLTSLGETATDEECKQIIAKYAPGQPQLDFDNYVRFMLDRFSKAETKESTTEAFRALAQNSPVITDEQLNKYFKPDDVEYLKTQLKPVDGGYDFASWVETLYQ